MPPDNNIDHLTLVIERLSLRSRADLLALARCSSQGVFFEKVGVGLVAADEWNVRPPFDLDLSVNYHSRDHRHPVLPRHVHVPGHVVDCQMATVAFTCLNLVHDLDAEWAARGEYFDFMRHRLSPLGGDINTSTVQAQVLIQAVHLWHLEYLLH